MELEIIEGIVSSIVFTNAENGYTVLRIETYDGVVTASGCMPGVSTGERLLISGSMSNHPQYGEQFKVDAFEVKPPSGLEDVFRYLASGAIKNIGIVRAREIVDKFGSDALSIIESDPDRLSEIKGVSLRTARKIGEDYRRQAGLRHLIDFLHKYDIKPLIATRVYKDYGDEAIDALRGNPYILISEQYGAQFGDADRIAIDLGFESDCTERIEAAFIFTLTHNLGNGHVFIPKDKLTAAVSELIGVSNDSVFDALDAICETGDVVIDTIAGLQACYLKHMFEAESFVAKRISEQLGIRNEELGIIKATNKQQFPKADSINYSKLQQKALEVAAQRRMLVLTGGPGTGKTTTVQGILKMFEGAGLKTCLCAPTGRAAKRLSELCGSDAATIHRLLGAGRDDGATPVFEHDELNPLDTDAIIIDECSMIDILLMNALLRALKPGCRIILVGDADQLPPIGPGNMFTDIIRSESVPVVALTEIFRQAQDSGIVQCAHLVNSGAMPDLTVKYTDFFFLSRRSDEQLAETIAELCSERLPKNMNIDPSQIQVLSPTRKRTAGTGSLNNLLREKLNPPGTAKKEKQHGNFIFRTGDKVMQIKNNYDILWKAKSSSNKATNKLTEGSGIFNGDVGVITDIDHSKESITVDFEDKTVVYTFEQLSELEPAYAITVHKSQGSEYHAVILAMTNAAPQLLTRSVLYTAMTRAKALLIIVGSADAMNKMVQNDKRQKRYSGLKFRLMGKG